jgi:hypothetical protein
MECKVFVAICLLLIAYYFPSIKIYYDSLNNNQKSTLNIEQEIINSWKYLIKHPNRQDPLKISVGYTLFIINFYSPNIKHNFLTRLNTNVDLITSAIPLLQLLNSSLGLITQHNHPVINSIEEFKQTFAYFFEKGSAAERFISKLSDFNRIIDSTESLDNHVK